MTPDTKTPTTIREIRIDLYTPGPGDAPRAVCGAEVNRRALQAELDRLGDVHDRLDYLADAAGFGGRVKDAISAVDAAGEEIADAVEAESPAMLDADDGA